MSTDRMSWADLKVRLKDPNINVRMYTEIGAGFFILTDADPDDVLKSIIRESHGAKGLPDSFYAEMDGDTLLIGATAEEKSRRPTEGTAQEPADAR